MDPKNNIKLPIIAVNMITTQILMSVESQGSFSNKLEQLRKSTVQDKQLTRLKGYKGFQCGHIRKCYPSNQDSLLVGTES